MFHVCRIRFSCQLECRSWAAQPFSEDRKVCATDVIEVFADSKEGGRKGERVGTIIIGMSTTKVLVGRVRCVLSYS